MSRQFHPLTLPLANGVAPVHAFWAEDDAVLALGDGAEVTSWANRGSNGTAATTTTVNSPTLALDGVNGRPGLVFDAASDDHLSVDVADTDTIAQPLTIVWVADVGVHSANSHSISGASSAQRTLAMYNYSASSGMFAGTPQATNLEVPAGPTVGVSVYNGADSFIRLNAAIGTPDGSPGTAGLDGLALGGRYDGASGHGNSTMALVYVFDSDVTSAPWFREWELGLRGHYNTDTVPQPAAGIGRKLYTIFEEDFTLTTSGTLATGTPGIDESGTGWKGDAGDWDYSGDGSGVDVPEGGNSYIFHDTNGREDVQQTIRFTMAVGGASGRTNGRLIGRSIADNVNNSLLLLWVCNGATTDADLQLLDVDTATTLHTWDISTLAEQVDENDDLELVIWWLGNKVVLRSLTVNGVEHMIGSAYTLTGTPATAHGAGLGRDQYGMGNAERVVSSSNDRTTYYKLESLAGL